MPAYDSNALAVSTPASLHFLPRSLPLPASPAPRSPSLATRRVLIADENAAVRHALYINLRALGHEVRAVASAREALAVAQDWQPDFVFVDVTNPKLGGVEVGRELGAQFPSMRLIGTSGHRLDELTLLDATEAGFDHCIGKPFTIEVLDAVVRGEAATMWELV